MTISPAEDVKTVEDLEANPRALLKQAQRTGRPIVIAQAGKPAVVMLSAERYEWLIHCRNLRRLLDEAEKDIRAGRTRPAEEVFEELLGGKKKKAR